MSDRSAFAISYLSMYDVVTCSVCKLLLYESPNPERSNFCGNPRPRMSHLTCPSSQWFAGTTAKGPTWVRGTHETAEHSGRQSFCGGGWNPSSRSEGWGVGTRVRGARGGRPPAAGPPQQPARSSLACSAAGGPAPPCPDLERAAPTLWDSPGHSGGCEMGGPHLEPRGLAAKPLSPCGPSAPAPGPQRHSGPLAPCLLGVMSQRETGV